jgi:two-component system, NtrC family, sensor histidine kinase KinB
MTVQDSKLNSLELLIKISRELVSALDLHTVLERVLFLSISSIGADRGSLIVMDEQGKPFDAAIVYANKLHTHTVQQLQAILDQGLAGWVVRNRKPAFVLDTSKDDRWLRRPDDEQDRTGPKSAICIPLNTRDQLVGVLTIVHPTSNSFTQSQFDLIQIISDQAGIAIRNAHLYESLQQAHQRYHELFEDSIEPIFVTDYQGHILEANRQAAHSTGISLADLPLHTINELHEIHWDKVGKDFLNLENNRTIFYESQLKGVDKQPIPVEVYIRSIQLENQVCLQWILRDISQTKELELLREDMIAMIYHDLRSPLANIISSLDMLSTLLPSESNPSLQTVYGIANRSTDRMQRLINSLLDINRLESGQPITNQTSVDAHILAKDAIEAVQPNIENKHQMVTLDLPDNLPLLWVDSDMIRRVIINLLENAVKYTPANSQVNIGGSIEADFCKLWVQDNGPGIPREEQIRIFEKFTRLQSNRFPKGIGLGLAFCRLAIEAHGGKIWVESNIGEGSRFIFTLPAAQ